MPSYDSDEEEEEKAPPPSNRKRSRNDDGDGGRQKRSRNDDTEERSSRQRRPRASHEPVIDELGVPMPPPPGADEGLPELVPVPLHDNDWEAIDKSNGEPVTDPNWCFWCHYAQSQHQYKANPLFAKLVSYCNKNYGMKDKVLYVRNVQGIYNKHIRNYLLNAQGQRRRGPVWPARSIMEHPLTHQLIPRAALEHVSQSMLRMMFMIEQSGLVDYDPATNSKQVNHKAVALYLRIWKELRPNLAQVGTQSSELFGLT